MADPEQIYQEVLQEEQGKGVSGPVAEGRAKAARARAEAGSPHPKEPKWWPGAQPHLEGGDAEAGAAEAAEAEPEPEAVPAEQPAAETPADEQTAAEAPEQPAVEAAPAPAAQADAEQAPAAAAPAATDQEAGRGAATTAPAPAAGVVAAPAAVATEPEQRQVTGVTHGTPTGNRLRPEDGVASEAQFEGQRAMYERRKLIDELVATGVPAAAAATTGRQRAPWLAILYLIIPLLVVGFIVANSEKGENTAEPAPQDTSSGGGAGGGGGGGGGTVSLVAQGLAFDTETIEVTAGEPTPAELTNEDTALHNIVIFDNPDEASGEELFTSPDVDAGSSESFEIDPLDEGEYFFHCAYHPQMEGTVTSS